MQGFSLTFWLIIISFLAYSLHQKCKGLPLRFGLISSYSQTYFQVSNVRVYLYFLAYYQAIRRLISSTRLHVFTLTFCFVIKLFVNLCLGLECKCLPLLFGLLSSYSQIYFQHQNARSVYPYFLAYYQAIRTLISRTRMQVFTLTFCFVIKLFVNLCLGLECKCLPLLFGLLSSYSQIYFQHQDARVYPYFLAYYQAIRTLISRTRMQVFTLTFCFVIKLFVNLCLGLECKCLPLLFGLLSSYSQAYFQVCNARLYPYFLPCYQAILRLISRSRMQGFTLTFSLIIQLFLDLFLGLECKNLPLLFGSLSSCSQTYFQVENARVYPYFFAHYPAIRRLISRSRMQGFTLTFVLLSSCSQTYFQVQNANVYPYFLPCYQAIL